MASNPVLKITVFRAEDRKETFFLSAPHHDFCYRFENLKDEMVSRCPELKQFEEIKFYWLDEDKDEITIANHIDYVHYITSCNAAKQKARIYVRGIKITKNDAAPPQRVDVRQVEQETTHEFSHQDLPVHTNVVCDVCDDVIQGHRYKCMECFNYDLCMRCEAKYRHKDHLMIRIPSQEKFKGTPFRLFDKIRNYATDATIQSGFAQACDMREDDYENSKRSKRHHRKHSKEREETKESRDEKERKERRHRRERSKLNEERRCPHRRNPFGQNFNFSHLINKVIDPANIQSAFLSSDAAAAAAAAAAESAHEAAQAAMANCPLFAAAPKTTATSSSATAATTATAAATTSATSSASTSETTSTIITTPVSTSATKTVPETKKTADKPEESSAHPSGICEPVVVKDATTSNNHSPGPKPADIIDLSWLAPSAESLQRINETFSKILDPLGMNIEIRSSSSTPTQKQDKTTETANTPTTSTPSQTVTSTETKAVGVDPLLDLGKQLEDTLLAQPLSQAEKQLAEGIIAQLESDDEDSSSVSSVSLLSVNDDHNEYEKTHTKWTLVDIPNDEAEPVNLSKSTENAKETGPIEQVEIIASTSSANVSAIPATPPSVPEAVSVSSVNNNQTAPIDYEQLGKALKQHLEAEKQAVSSSDVQKKVETPKVTKEPPQPPAKVTLPTQQAITSTTTYSRLAHVNHAVHTMMSMGFSNEGGWLTQLLEAVNGDIPRALDLLTPHKITP